MPERHHPRRAPRGVILVCIAGVLWGTAPIAFEAVHHLTGLGAIQISAYRLAIAALALAVIAAFTGSIRSAQKALQRRPIPIVAIGIGVASYQALWFAAITQVGASVATVLSLGLAPVLIIIWESWSTRTRPTKPQLLAVATALVGLILVSSAAKGSAAAGSPALGLVLASASGLLYAATTIVSRRVALTVSPLPLSTATTTVGALSLTPVALLAGPVMTTEPTAILSLAYLGVVTMALASLLLYSGLRSAPASTAAIATLLEPVTAAVLAVVVLAESLSLTAVVGIGLILAAVAITNLSPTRLR